MAKRIKGTGPPVDQPVPTVLPAGVKLVRTLEGHSGNVNGVAFDPRSGTLASGSDDKTVKLWEARSGKVLCTLEGHQDTVYSVAFDPQGGMLSSRGDDNTVRLWDARSGKLLRTLEGHQESVYSLVFDPQGGMLASGSADNTVKLLRHVARFCDTSMRHRGKKAFSNQRSKPCLQICNRISFLTRACLKSTIDV